MSKIAGSVGGGCEDVHLRVQFAKESFLLLTGCGFPSVQSLSWCG